MGVDGRDWVGLSCGKGLMVGEMEISPPFYFDLRTRFAEMLIYIAM